ncbi:MAG: ribose 5-phosphate isomerase B [Candidatus Sumerlaeaceae bacterium]
MKIAFSNDHAAVEERGRLISGIKKLGHEVIDYGTDENKSVDYPDMAEKAIEAVAGGDVDRTVLICGSGVGMSMVANRVPGVRCALVTDLYAAAMSRRHNDSNCLSLRSREQSPELNEQILKTWLETPFEGGRHQGRVQKIDEVGRRISNAAMERQSAKQ